MNHNQDDNSIGLMAAMMAMCASVLILVAVIPAVGFAAGLAIAVTAGALLVVGHRRFLGHGSGH
jgi:hypothetical protein